MATLDIRQIPTRTDNYVYLFRDPDSGQVGIVDPSDAAPVIAALEDAGWTPTHIINTHHHGDHTGGNLEIKEKYGVTVVGPKADHDRIAGIDIDVGDGDTFQFGSQIATVFDTPGHTRGHIAFHFADSGALFCGDTLFALGCGRVFEGTMEQMWTSLEKLRALPDDTRVYCAHEYTQANARFALTVETTNEALRDYAQEIDDKRARNEPTVPSLLGKEKATNPFLRADISSVAQSVGLDASDPVSVFAEVRTRKDNF